MEGVITELSQLEKGSCYEITSRSNPAESYIAKCDYIYDDHAQFTNTFNGEMEVDLDQYSIKSVAKERCNVIQSGGARKRRQTRRRRQVRHKRRQSRRKQSRRKQSRSRA